MSSKGRKGKNVISIFKRINRFRKDNTIRDKEKQFENSDYQYSIIDVFDANVPYRRVAEKSLSSKRERHKKKLEKRNEKKQ